MNTRLLAPALGLLLAACGASGGSESVASSPWLVPATGQTNAVSGTKVERFFPLVDGMVYTYVPLHEVGDAGMLIARVHRTDPNHGELRFPTGAKQFELAPDGVMVHGRAGESSYVLKIPLQVGTSWRGEHGGQSRILKSDAIIETPAGHYENCVQTLEERLGDRPTRYSTTFCPTVGVVQIEVATGANYERAALKSYAPPLRMREDGTERLPPGTPDQPSP